MTIEGKMDMSLNESWHNVGEKIRYLRKSYGLTLKQLANGSGLSVNTISLVERSEVAPTIETLCKIARALGVSPSSLFLEICYTGVNLRRAKEPTCETDRSEQILQLFAKTQRNTLGEAKNLENQIQPQFKKHDTVLCLCGRVALELDGQNYRLFTGDSLDFNSANFHRWDNLENETGIVVLVIPPTIPEKSGSREDHDNIILEQ